MLPRLLPLLVAFACASKGGPAVRGQAMPEAVVPPAPPGTLQKTAHGMKYAEVLEDLTRADIVLLAADNAFRLRTLEFLAARGRLHAIGLESLPRTAQKALDDFSFHRIDETELEERIGPIPDADRRVLTLARERRLPLLGLGLEQEIRQAMLATGTDGSPLGRDGLSEEQRRSLPPVPSFALPEKGAPDAALYLRLLETEVETDVVVSWYREAAPQGAQVAILAARERIAPRDRLPGRMSTRAGKSYRTVVALSGKVEACDPSVFAPGYADYLFFTEEQ